MTTATSQTVQPATEYLPKRTVSRMPGFTLHGRVSHRLRSIWLLDKVTMLTTLRHLFGRPTVKGWSWTFECANLFLREQWKTAFTLGSIVEGREFLDALTFNPAEAPEVDRRPSDSGEPAGDWFLPRHAVRGTDDVVLPRRWIRFLREITRSVDRARCRGIGSAAVRAELPPDS